MMTGLAFNPLRSTVGRFLVAGLLVSLIPLVVTDRYALQIANLTMIYIVIAVGLNITMGYAGLISIAQSALAAIGGYTSALLVMRLGWPFPLAAVAGVIAAAFAGTVMGLLSYRVRTHYVLLVTLGFHIAVQLVIRNETELTGGPVGLYPIPRIDIGGWVVRTQQQYFYLFLSVTTVFVCLADLLRTSRVGLAMLALKNNERGARAVGISPAYYRILAMTIGAAYAGAGGIMFAFSIRFLGPESFDLHSSLLYILIVVLGGLGNNWGLIFVAVLLTVSTEYLKIFAESWVLIYGILIIVVMIALPGGVAELFERVKAALNSKRPDATQAPGQSA